MFSLPSIAKLEKQADERRAADKKAKSFTCDFCDKEMDRKATVVKDGVTYGWFVEEWFSPLSEKANGILHVCPECVAHNEENYGTPYGADGEESGYFVCAECERLQQYSHSWEIYATRTDDGLVCMECVGKRHLASESAAWLDKSTDIDAFVQNDDALRSKVKHLTCIDGAKVLPGGCIDFRESPEYAAEGLNWWNSMEFGGWGDTSRSRQELAENIKTVLKFYRRCAPFLAEAGQFQAYLSIAVHPRDRKGRRAGVDKALGHNKMTA
jgi:hypothetical protein